MRCLGGGGAHHQGEESVITRHAQQAQADHQHAGNGTALEGDVQRSVEAILGSFRGAHVGAHRDVHADIASEAGQHRAKRKTDGSLPAQRHINGDQQNRTDDADGGVLPVQISRRAFLHRRLDFPHAVVAGG